MMGADEKFVREHWAYVRSWVRDLDSYGTDQSNVALYYSEDNAKYGHDYFQRWQEDVGKEDAVWSSAAEFTRNRLEEIRQVEEEIEWVKSVAGVQLEVFPEDEPARILARLQAALAELKRGMR